MRTEKEPSTSPEKTVPDLSWNETSARKMTESSPRLTLCLAMDLKASTATGLKLSTRKRDRFNLALINQMHPYLEAMGLENALIKFTGDGWLVMTDDPDQAAALCCLAVIMANRFQLDMVNQAGLRDESVPAMRLAICWARDLPVELPHGQRDFVGDSARHAVRASQLCKDNEILIDETVRRWVHLDFITESVDFNERLKAHPNSKLEEVMALYTLKELKAESAAEVDAPIHFVNTLAIVGRSVEAMQLASRIADQWQHEATGSDANQNELLSRFNRLLSGSLGYEAASQLLKDMREAGIEPNVETFNALISKAKDSGTQWIWFQRMRQSGVEPNIKTFNILVESAPDESVINKWLVRMSRVGVKPDSIMLNTIISRSKDHAGAVRWLERMKKWDVKPTIATYELLISKAEEIRSAMNWVDQMFEEGIQPSMVSLLAVFAKDVRAIPAEEILKWYLNLPFHPPEPMHRAISAYRKAGLIEDALRLALDYPYTEAARRIFRKHPNQTLDYFQSFVQANPQHPNGAYALGTALVELGRNEEAEPWLIKALQLSAPGPRRNEVLKLLEAQPAVLESSAQKS